MHLLDTLAQGLKEIDERGLRRRRRTASPASVYSR